MISMRQIWPRSKEKLLPRAPASTRLTGGKYRPYFQRTDSCSAVLTKIDFRTFRNVTWAKYNEALESLNIFVKTSNFLVFQGRVQEIARMDDRKRMWVFTHRHNYGLLFGFFNPHSRRIPREMIEEISRSSEYKEEYDRLKVLLCMCL